MTAPQRTHSMPCAERLTQSAVSTALPPRPSLPPTTSVSTHQQPANSHWNEHIVKKVKVAHTRLPSIGFQRADPGSCYPTASRLRFEPGPSAPESSMLTTRLPSHTLISQRGKHLTRGAVLLGVESAPLSEDEDECERESVTC